MSHEQLKKSLVYVLMTLSRKLRLVCLMFLLVCTVGCDQTTKHIARVGLSQTGSFTLSGGLVELRLAENPGSFLSFGALLPNPARFTMFTLGVGVGLVALAAYLVSRVRLDLWRFIGLSLEKGVTKKGSSLYFDPHLPRPSFVLTPAITQARSPHAAPGAPAIPLARNCGVSVGRRTTWP